MGLAVAVAGASGYAGGELLRLIGGHRHRQTHAPLLDRMRPRPCRVRRPSRMSLVEKLCTKSVSYAKPFGVPADPATPGPVATAGLAANAGGYRA